MSTLSSLEIRSRLLLWCMSICILKDCQCPLQCVDPTFHKWSNPQSDQVLPCTSDPGLSPYEGGGEEAVGSQPELSSPAKSLPFTKHSSKTKTASPDLPEQLEPLYVPIKSFCSLGNRLNLSLSTSLSFSLLPLSSPSL